MVRRAARIPPLFLTPRHVSPIQKKVGSAGPSRRGAPIEARLDGSPELTLNVNAPCRHRTHADRIVYRPSNPRIQEQVHG